MLRDDRVVAATLTGSAPAGQSVAAIAGDALKKTVLELGGSDPFIVMPSADLEKAAEVAVTARSQNNGQSCIAAKRFFVHRDVAEEFTRLFAEKIAALTVGDPMDEDTQIGPLATESGREDVEKYVQDAVGKGATVLVGGKRADGPGWFYPPTLLTGITPEMDLYFEEVFGPVAALFTVDRPGRGDRDREQSPVRPRRQPLERGRGRAGRGSSATSPPAWRSSTGWSPATRSCPSAA